jgi:hypothetical protein
MSTSVSFFHANDQYRYILEPTLEGFQARNKYTSKGYLVRSWKEGKNMTAQINTKHLPQTESVPSQFTTWYQIYPPF